MLSSDKRVYGGVLWLLTSLCSTLRYKPLRDFSWVQGLSRALVTPNLLVDILGQFWNCIDRVILAAMLELSMYSSIQIIYMFIAEWGFFQVGLCKLLEWWLLCPVEPSTFFYFHRTGFKLSSFTVSRHKSSCYFKKSPINCWGCNFAHCCRKFGSVYIKCHQRRRAHASGIEGS